MSYDHLHTEDCDPEFGCDEKCTAPLPPDDDTNLGPKLRYPAVPISSPRCDEWRPAVPSDPYPSTEVRCRFAARHPGQHSAYGTTWGEDCAR